jgi:hypothetical protein
MNTVQSLLEHYSKSVIPEDAPDIQIFETKNAFYAGALSLLKLQLQLPDNDNIAAMILDNIHKECNDYFENLPTANDLSVDLNK